MLFHLNLNQDLEFLIIILHLNFLHFQINKDNSLDLIHLIK